MELTENIDTVDPKKYICLRCGFNTDVKKVLHCHLQTKRECLPLCKDISRQEILNTYFNKTTSFQCKKCKKYYKNNDTLKKHICKVDANNIIETETETDAVNENIVLDEIEITKNKDKEEKIVHRDITCPRVDYITTDTLIDMYNAGGGAYVRLANLIYLNDDYVENHLVYCHNVKECKAKYYINEFWRVAPFSEVLPIIMKVIQAFVDTVYHREFNKYIELDSKHKQEMIKLEYNIKDKQQESRSISNYNKRKELEQEIVILSKKIIDITDKVKAQEIITQALSSLVTSMNSKKAKEHPRYRKAIKSNIINFTKRRQDPDNKTKLHPITHQYCTSLREWIQEQVQEQMDALLNR
jgi:hypothetical protein